MTSHGNEHGLQPEHARIEGLSSDGSCESCAAVWVSCSEKDRTIQFAKTQLELYLQKTGGIICACSEREAQVAISLRLVPEDGYKDEDWYRVCVDTRGGSIEAGNPRSVLLGVYAYLRAIGFRFVHPGPEGDVIPSLGGAESLCARLEGKAGLRHRGICIEGADSIENILAFIDWMPKLGFNSFFVQFKDSKTFLERWYQHVNNPKLAPEPVEEAQMRQYHALVDDAMALRGLLHHRVGHGWTGEAMGLEATGWESLEQTAPAQLEPLLAKINGTRGFFGGVPTNTNLCYSNPQAIDRMANAVVRYAKKHPEVDYLHVWLADECNNICECDACRQTTPSDQYIQLLNEIDERLSRETIQTRIVFLIYQELLFAPLAQRFAHSSRFTMMFAPISRTFEQSYPQKLPDTPPPAYRRNQFTLPVDLQENLAHLAAWQKVFSGDSFVYDYPLGRAHYGDLGYISISEVLAGDIRAVASLGLNGYLSCQELRAGFPNFLPNYLMGYLLFDPKADVQALIQEYFAAAYGEENTLACRYLHSLSALCSCDYFNGKGIRRCEKMQKRYRQAARQAETFLEQANERADRSDGVRKTMWRILALHAGYAQRMADALAALAGGEQEEADRLFVQTWEYLCEFEMEFQPFMDVYRVSEVAGKYTGFHFGI